MSFKVYRVISAHMLIQIEKELLSDERSITQSIESSQSRFLSQISIFFKYFESVEFS